MDRNATFNYCFKELFQEDSKELLNYFTVQEDLNGSMRM